MLGCSPSVVSGAGVCVRGVEGDQGPAGRPQHPCELAGDRWHAPAAGQRAHRRGQVHADDVGAERGEVSGHVARPAAEIADDTACALIGGGGQQRPVERLDGELVADRLLVAGDHGVVAASTGGMAAHRRVCQVAASMRWRTWRRSRWPAGRLGWSKSSAGSRVIPSRRITVWERALVTAVNDITWRRPTRS